MDWPTPANFSRLKSFLGLASYYRRFVKDSATIVSPLHKLTKEGQTFKWDAPAGGTFAQLRARLATAHVLEYPDPARTFILDTNASSMGLNAVLSQEGKNGKRVIAYFSQALSAAERNYSVTCQKLLAVAGPASL